MLKKINFRERRFWLVLLICSLAWNVYHQAGSAALRAEPAREAGQRYQYILQSLLHQMQSTFVEEVSEEILLEGAVRGLLRAGKDPYTRFLNADEMKEFQEMEGGSRIGIGVELVIQNGEPLIIAPIKGGPAGRAGVLAGDRIIAVDGVVTRNLSITQLTKLITGEQGTSLELKIQRAGVPDPVKIEIVRGAFEIDYVKSYYFEKEHIGYLQLTHFFGESSGSIDSFRENLQKFKSRNARGVIIDLRNNTGGHLDMAAVLAGLFLKPGQNIVEARGRVKRWNRILKADQNLGAGKFQKIPLLVLVNGSSASASEIMAGALQDYKRARLLGERTFGKASVQRIVRGLPADSGALITIQKYYTPLGRLIHGKGLEPDIKVGGVNATREENFYFFKMNQVKFLNNFKKENPKYTPKIPDLFLAQARKRGWIFKRHLAVRFLKDRYGVRPIGPVDLEADPQLQRALRELR